MLVVYIYIWWDVDEMISAMRGAEGWLVNLVNLVLAVVARWTFN